jgi:4'-phosphopantetheinyl transferase
MLEHYKIDIGSSFTAPPSPLLPNTVHIWQMVLPRDCGCQDARLSNDWLLLDEDERARVGRLLRATHRDSFITTRATLRRLLAAYLCCMPRAVKFQENSYGKLAVANQDAVASHSEDGVAPLPLQFNLSHSGNVVLYAFALQRQVGIDIERICADVPVLEIAQRFFAPAESATLSVLSSPALQRRAFFNCWTRKEAAIKAVGCGLSQTLDGFVVPMEDADDGAELKMMNVRRDVNCAMSDDTHVASFAVQDWILFNLHVAPQLNTHPHLSEQYCAALVVENNASKTMAPSQAQIKIKCYSAALL